jgi:hypothetical protein
MRHVQVDLTLLPSGEWDLEVAEWDIFESIGPGTRAAVLQSVPGLFPNDVPDRLRALVDAGAIRRDTAVALWGVPHGTRSRGQVWDMMGKSALPLPCNPTARIAQE